MKNRIRGIPLVLLLVALLTAACGAIKNTTSEQTASSEQSSFGAQLEAQAAAVHDTHRHAQEQTQTDSTTTRREYTEPVPEERTDMTIPTQSLLDLPDGAKYSAQNGRASIEAERQAGIPCTRRLAAVGRSSDPTNGRAHETAARHMVSVAACGLPCGRNCDGFAYENQSAEKYCKTH